MLAEEAGWLQLIARRESPDHLQVRVLRVRDSRSRKFPYRWTVDAVVYRILRSTPEADNLEPRLRVGEPISFQVEFCVRGDASFRERPIGPITVSLDDLEAARFLEVFLDHGRMVAAGQVEPIAGTTSTPRMSSEDPDLIRLSEKRRRAQSETERILSEYHRLTELLSRLAEEHRFDAFRPSGVTVFECGDMPVVRIMLPEGHPTDVGSLRKLVKQERAAGRVSKCDARIACTRQHLTHEQTHNGETSVFLA